MTKPSYILSPRVKNPLVLPKQGICVSVSRYVYKGDIHWLPLDTGGMLSKAAGRLRRDSALESIPHMEQWSLHLPGSQAAAVVQLLSHVWLFATSWIAAHQASQSFAISRSLLKFMSIELVMLSNHLILCLPLLLLPSVFPSLRVFFNESTLYIRWPKYWSFSFSISPFKEYSGLISFSIDWFDLLAIQGTLKSLLQYYKVKASVLQCSAFCMIQLSNPFVTTRKKHSFDYAELCWQRST